MKCEASKCRKIELINEIFQDLVSCRISKDTCERSKVGGLGDQTY